METDDDKFVKMIMIIMISDDDDDDDDDFIYLFISIHRVDGPFS